MSIEYQKLLQMFTYDNTHPYYLNFINTMKEMYDIVKTQYEVTNGSPLCSDGLFDDDALKDVYDYMVKTGKTCEMDVISYMKKRYTPHIINRMSLCSAISIKETLQNQELLYQ